MSAFGAVAVERARPRTVLVAVAVLVALGVNLLVYAIGRLAGGSFRFPAPTGASVVNEVDALTVAGFTVVPLLVGLALAAALSRRWPRVLTVALVVAPVLALATIALGTVPAGFDTTSTVALGSCHVVAGLVAVLALLRLRRLHPHRPA